MALYVHVCGLCVCCGFFAEFFYYPITGLDILIETYLGSPGLVPGCCVSA